MLHPFRQIRLGFALALSLCSHAGAAQEWPTHRFEVRNEDPSGEYGTVPADPAFNRQIEAHLGTAAALLDRRGFPAPDLWMEPDSLAYPVYLVSERLPVPGMYVDGACGEDPDTERRIYIRADPEGTAPGLQFLAHELFHAVQFAMPFYRACGAAGDWIIEGQAEAIGRDLAEEMGEEQPGGAGPAIGRRSYSHRLPMADALPDSAKEMAYRTSSFWRFLASAYAEASGGGVRVRGRRLDYSYLVGLHQAQASARDCIGSGASCDAELAWLNDGLAAVFGQRLRDLYPRFVLSYVTDAVSDYEALRGSRETFFGTSFDGGCTRIELRPDAVRQRATVPRFDDVSAQCWRVDVAGFEDETVRVRVSTLGPPTARQLEQLTAIRAGDAARADTADVLSFPGDSPRAAWTYALPNNATTLILLANVAHDPETTTPLPGLQVMFTALREHVSMAESGAASPQDLPDALPIDLDAVTAQVVSGQALERAGDELCVFSLLARQRSSGDRLFLQMHHQGPIGPGSYPMSAGDRPVLLEAEDAPPNTFVGGFELGRGNPLSGGQAQNFFWQSGTVTITSVSGGFIEGEVRGIGWRDPSPRRYGAEPFGMASFSVIARFAFANDRFAARPEMQRRFADACVTGG